MEGFVLLGLAVALYFAPTIVAASRHHQSAPAIFVLNLFLGWTFLGWLAALVWSLAHVLPDEYRRQTQRPEPLPLVRQPAHKAPVSPVALIAGLVFIAVLSGAAALFAWNNRTAPPAMITAAHAPEASPRRPNVAKKLEVVLTIAMEGKDTPRVIGTTNLPDGTLLMVSLRRPESAYAGEQEVAVRGGKFRSKEFSYKGAPLTPGRYYVDVISPLAHLQPASVREQMGSKGENLSGPVTQAIHGARAVSVTRTAPLPGAEDAEADAMRRKIAQQDKKRWLVESCKTVCGIRSRSAAETSDAFDMAGCQRQCLSDPPKK